MALVTFTQQGLYCPQADVYIDPWQPVNKAIITHAHADHSRAGMKQYLAHKDSVPVMRQRLGEIQVQAAAYGEVFNLNGVKISLHPAGHILGSAQIKLSYKGETWCISGDYKVQPDATCTPFEPVECTHFVTESTFGLPVFKWKSDQQIFDEINNWWRSCASQGKTPVLLAYALGKAQRVLGGLDASIGPVLTHGAVENVNELLRDSGHHIPKTTRVTADLDFKQFKNAIVLATPSAQNTSWLNRFKPFEIGFVSGWMQLRGARRRRNVDRGFVLSDHADWEGLNEAVKATTAEHIYVTHGYRNIYSQWLSEQGLEAQVVETAFEGELSELNATAATAKEEDSE